MCTIIFKLVDHLALYKMNVFHWHLTDYFGWRLESKCHPELQSDRATARHKGCFYTQAQFRELVDYGWERGVTIIPELDVPGHTLALRRGLGVGKMREEKVRGIVADLNDELCSLAPAERMPYIHLGTDEVDLGSADGTEWVPHEWIDGWAARVTANGRILLGWWPGERIDAPGPQIKEIWGWAHYRKPEERAGYGNARYIDSTEFDYINHIDPFEMLNAGAFQKPGPNWAHPGVSGPESREVPLTDEDYFYRPPHIVHLRAGWNHIRITLPKPKTDFVGQKWLGTFVPVLGPSDHPREFSGLLWAGNPPSTATDSGICATIQSAIGEQP